MSKLSELVLVKRAEVEALLQAELRAKETARRQLDYAIGKSGLWSALGVTRPTYSDWGSNELVYRVAVPIADKTYNLKIVVAPSRRADIYYEQRAHSLYIVDIVDVAVVIERLAEYLQ